MCDKMKNVKKYFIIHNQNCMYRIFCEINFHILEGRQKNEPNIASGAAHVYGHG